MLKSLQIQESESEPLFLGSSFFNPNRKDTLHTTFWSSNDTGKDRISVCGTEKAASVFEAEFIESTFMQSRPIIRVHLFYNLYLLSLCSERQSFVSPGLDILVKVSLSSCINVQVPKLPLGL